jgi:copper homeostasis protein
MKSCGLGSSAFGVLEVIAIFLYFERAGSAIEAGQGGADRVELCADLSVGGVTPAPGEVAEACRLLAIPVHVLIRPRGGDFVYSADELALMEQDIEVARAHGAAGVVVGANRADGTIDAPALARLVARARPLSVTYHKAFDVLRDPVEALRELSRLGVDRVLTSGQAATARAGLPVLADLVRQGARTAVMAGGQIREEDLPDLLAAGVREIHVGSAVASAGRTDAGRVRHLARILRMLDQGRRDRA